MPEAATTHLRRTRGGDGGTRREQLLAIAGELFAARGYQNTTVRDIAEAAGILSGSLYHHFDSKEAIVDELLVTFQATLLQRYDAIMASDLDARGKVEAVVRASFDAIDSNPSEVAIFLDDGAYLVQLDRFGYLRTHNERYRQLWLDLLGDGVSGGAFRPDLDPVLVYRFVRDTVWVAVRWYRPDGPYSAQQVADQYLAILMDGIATPTRRPRRAPTAIEE